MSTEQILKLQPDRTIYLRGFDGTGAAASLCQASPTGFTVYGVFRDMADFCVLILYDQDNIFEHYSVRYLPDPDLSGIVLSFDIHYQGLQPIDSAKFSWIDWAQLDVLPADGSKAVQIELWDHATLVSGNYSVAQGTFTFTTTDPNGKCHKFDRLTLFVNNAQFDFVAQGDETAADVALWFANSINANAWWQYAYASVAVIASAGSDGTLTLKYARTGLANVSGTTVELVDFIPDPLPDEPNHMAKVTSNRFPGIAQGATIYINPKNSTLQVPIPYAVAAVSTSTSVTLASSAGTQTLVPYLVEYGGSDGNDLTVYITRRTENLSLHVDREVLSLTGGSSDVTWHISLDFSALGIDHIRQAWLTFAPQLANGTEYTDTEWTATFTNWSVQDPSNKRPFKIAGPGSIRVGNDERSCVYTGTGWNIQSANNYWHGFARVTHQFGDSVTVTYTATQLHDLYLGTALYVDRRSVSVTLNGVAVATVDCYLNTGSEITARRLLRPAVAAGTHIVTFTVGGLNVNAKSAAVPPTFAFVLDYLEAAVPTTEVPDALITYPNVSPALDFDTDATYKMSPQRLLWHILKLGFRGQLNEYLGVFWWNQRKRAEGVFHSAIIDFNQVVWAENDIATITIGLGNSAFLMRKSVVLWETDVNPDDPSHGEAIARHFTYYINSASVQMWATCTGSKLTIAPRTPNWGTELLVTRTPAGTEIVNELDVSGDVKPGKDGVWQVDPTVENPINFPVRQWHSDLFSLLKAADLLVTVSFSMELVNPPDDGQPGNEWQARYYDSKPVTTDTGFANLLSSQCSFIKNMTEYQERAFTVMAGLQSAAGLTPWLQFGEFLWWFFSEIALNIFSLDAATNSVDIQLGQIVEDDAMLDHFVVASHKMSTGDRIVISGVRGCTSANGTWPITVKDPTHFTIPVAPNGIWDGSSGQVRGGSMAYYDTVTKDAAQSALGRPLITFTCQDDDPTVNNSADANFLAAQLKAHIDAIRTAVLAQYPDSKFELLYPNDVNNPVCLLGPGVQFAQGGRLNAAVNLPIQYLTQQGSGLDRFKVEALSWGATYLNMDLAHQAIVFALTDPMAWQQSDAAYLIPWFNGTCPWPREFHLANSRGLHLINFWAYDHLSLMSWPLPLPTWFQRSFMAG